MNPQLGSTSSRVVFFLLSFLAITLALPAHAAPPGPASCSMSNLPQGPAAFIATSPNLVSVLDASTQPVTSIACRITVGNGPSNLAFSPDGTQLFVENDTDGTVSVVNLTDGTIAGTVTLTSVTTPMTANLAVSPDGTFAYVVSLPATVVPGTTQASLTRIALPVAAGASAAPIVATLATPVTAAGLGVAFTPDATLAYIATEGLTYIVTTSTNTISSTTIAANGGSVAIDQTQTFAYVVDVANKGAGGNTVVNKIPLATNTPASLSPAPPCNLASTIAVAPNSTSGYFTCPGADSVQLIDTTANSITSTNTLSLAAGTSPQGVAVTSNGAFAFVAGGDGSITSIDTSVVPNTFTSFSDVGFAKNGLGFVPVLARVTPSPVNVQVKTTQPFAAALPRAYSQTVTWSLACAAGIASCGSIDPVTGVLTAPATVPSTPTVTIFADSTEVTNGTKKFFRGTATATITDISVAISAASPTVNINATDQFTLTLVDTTNGGVTWTISCAAGISVCGTISTTGLYSAPQIVPSPATVTVTATSITDPTKFDSKNITVISNVVVTVTPPAGAPPFLIGQPYTFTAPTTGDANNLGVTWSIGSCALTPTGSNPNPCGMIVATTGVYTAPPITTPANAVTIQATSKADATKMGTFQLTITSNVVITSFQLKDNNGAIVSQLLIEPLFYTLTPVITGDTGQGVKWAISSCSADPAGGALCGTITPTGTYTPPRIVPYALPVTPTSTASITFQATSNADLSVSKTFLINIGSTVAITGYQVNGAAPAQLLIETPSYTLTPVISGDTGQGVTWTILSCSAANPANTVSCGSFTNASTGVFAMPKIVPYALPVTPSSTASDTFQVTSVADPKVVFQPAAIAVGSTVAITAYQVNGAAPPAQLLIETPTYTLTPVISGDTGQGVTWTILSCSAANPANTVSCGSFTNTSTGVFAMPKIVPYALPVTPSSTASDTFQVTSVADPKVVFQPAAIAVGSTVAITAYQVNGAAPPAQLLIETPTYTLTPVISGDTGQGVTWTILSCSAANPAIASCGNFTNTTAGVFAMPKIVPYAPPITPSSTAVDTFQVTSIADPKIVFQPAAIGVASTIQLSMAAPNSIVALIEKAVDFTPNATNGNVTLMNDTNQGVTLAISGTCFAPPNFGTTPTIPCGSFAGNSYTAPSVVPLAAATPAASLGTAKPAVITITSTSVADPVHTASTTFSISSNISFGIAVGTDAQTMKDICNPFFYPSTDATLLTDLTTDPCGFKGWPANKNLSPPAPTLAVGFQAALAEAPNSQGFGTVTGLTWVVPAGSGSVPPASGTSTTFTAPTAPPSTNNSSATITAYAIADFTKSVPVSIPIVASKLIPDNIAIPFTLVVASAQSSGSIVLDFQGPTSGQITFACPGSGFVNLPNSTCAFSPNPSNATGTTVVTLTLSVIRSSVAPPQPPRAPRTPLPGLPGAFLATILLIFLILAFATGKWARLNWTRVPRWNAAFVIFVLCVVILTWVGACNQFSQPGIPSAPITGVTSATGSATVTGTPTTDSSPSTDSLAVPASVQ